MEGKLVYVAVIFVPEPAMERLLGKRDELLHWNSTGFMTWDSQLSIETYIERLRAAKFQGHAGNLVVDELLQTKLTILGKRIEDAGRLVIEFRPAFIQIYKVMINSSGYIQIKEPVSELQDLRWNCDPNPLPDNSETAALSS